MTKLSDDDKAFYMAGVKNPSQSYLDRLENPPFKCRFCGGPSPFCNEVCAKCEMAALAIMKDAVSQAVKTSSRT